MQDRDALQTNAGSLYRIQGTDQGIWHQWTDGELGHLYLRELCADIQTDPDFMSGPTAQKLVALGARQPLPNRLIDLFSHPQPSIEMLQHVKEWSKSARHHPDSPLQKISTVLYYAAILAALLRCGQRITNLDDGALLYGVDWVLAQPWIDPTTQRLFAEGRKALGGA